jgi:hypothetical protein
MTPHVCATSQFRRARLRVPAGTTRRPDLAQGLHPVAKQTPTPSEMPPSDAGIVAAKGTWPVTGLPLAEPSATARPQKRERASPKSVPA